MSFLLTRKASRLGSCACGLGNVGQYRPFSTSFAISIKRSQIVFDKSLDDLKKKPVKFTTSPAFNVNPQTAGGIRTEDDDTPWFQGPVIAFSMAAFLIYFTMLR